MSDQFGSETPEAERQNHLAWAKERALYYVTLGDLREAWASFTSDMSKHPATAHHEALILGHQLLLSKRLNSAEKMRQFIEGFQ